MNSPRPQQPSVQMGGIMGAQNQHATYTINAIQVTKFPVTKLSYKICRFSISLPCSLYSCSSFMSLFISIVYGSLSRKRPVFLNANFCTEENWPFGEDRMWDVGGPPEVIRNNLFLHNVCHSSDLTSYVNSYCLHAVL